MKKLFLVQKFITILILLRTHLRQIPLWAFTVIIIGLYIAKYRKEGYTYTILAFFLATILTLIGQFLELKAAYLSGLLLIVISNFIPNTVYYIPVVKPLIGLNQNQLSSGLYIYQFYSLKEQPKPKPYYKKWIGKLQMNKIYENALIASPWLPKSLFNLLMSYMKHYRVYFGAGQEQKSQQLIIFCPGKGATPMMYSNILMNLAKKRKVVSFQPTQQSQNPFWNNPQQAKKFREEQVIQRAQGMIKIFDYYSLMPQYKRIILAGHSYGSSTAFLAYSLLRNHQNSNKINNLILLDPWLYPLSQKMISIQCKVPILILANEFFVNKNDIHQRNMKFLQKQKQTQYYCFKNGDHIHQCDVPFVIGSNPLRKVINPQKTSQIIQKNVKAIQNFIGKKETLSGLSQEQFLPQNWSPSSKTFQIGYY